MELEGIYTLEDIIGEIISVKPWSPGMVIRNGHVRALFLNSLALEKLDFDFTVFPFLQYLDISWNDLKEFPESIIGL